MYKQDLALDNLQLLICHKTQPNLLLVLPPTCSSSYFYMNIYDSSLSLSFNFSPPLPKCLQSGLKVLGEKYDTFLNSFYPKVKQLVWRQPFFLM